MNTERREVVIVGGGFGGTLLARLLARCGRDVLLLERSERPGMALGESTTPLGNLALERLAECYRAPDLHALAAWGRFVRDLPEVRRGKKRGFSFYAHRAGAPYTPGPGNEQRLLVAASPDDQTADSHWWRADVDAYLLAAARAGGATVRPGVAVTAIEQQSPGIHLRWSDRSGGAGAVAAGFLVDATGGAALRRSLGVPDGPAASFRTALLDTHYESLPPLSDLVPELRGADAPYPEEWAAVHHLTEHGWMYQLRFDHGPVSVGFVVPSAALTAAPASEQLEALLRHYPTLRAQLDGAPLLRPLVARGALQHRAASAVGERFLQLPHAFAFYSPLFSTGIAWTLLAIERLVPLFRSGVPDPSALAAYDAELQHEADQIERLLAGAYALLHDGPAFAAYAMFYFALVSSAEAEQRLFPERPRRGFLDAHDPARRALAATLAQRARAAGARLFRAPPAERGALRAALEAAVSSAIEPFNVAGLADPARRNLYGVYSAQLVDSASKFGVAASEVTARLGRLRGADAPPVC